MSPSALRPLKVGIILPETEGQMNGETARWSDLLAMARQPKPPDSTRVVHRSPHPRGPKGEQGPGNAGR